MVYYASPGCYTECFLWVVPNFKNKLQYIIFSIIYISVSENVPCFRVILVTIVKFGTIHEKHSVYINPCCRFWICWIDLFIHSIRSKFLYKTQVYLVSWRDKVVLALSFASRSREFVVGFWWWSTRCGCSVSMGIVMSAIMTGSVPVVSLVVVPVPSSGLPRSRHADTWSTSHTLSALLLCSVRSLSSACKL